MDAFADEQPSLVPRVPCERAPRFVKFLRPVVSFDSDQAGSERAAPVWGTKRML
jgi:hypothetical protein